VLSPGGAKDKTWQRRREMIQLIVRLFFLLVDVGGNMYILTTKQPLMLGALQLDLPLAIVVFNAAMILVVYIVDFIIVKTQRLFIQLAVGEGLTDLHKHEQ
jgi:hypothetical protein